MQPELGGREVTAGRHQGIVIASQVLHEHHHIYCCSYLHLLASKKTYFGHRLFAKIIRSTIPAEYNTRAGIIDSELYILPAGTRELCQRCTAVFDV
jgi:hypothetical protein